ncbi:MAG: GNAT family N-acetyltransferase [Candidatus Bathyarchaeota archaeon]|nr:GNAT family N-acetyltransferase [Candidatus Bathyarchaeota archaeon]
MGRADFEFAVDLANTMNWNMATEDFEFMRLLEPDGLFLLVDGEEKLGIATAVSYGEVGWFGNLIVKKECRREGGGGILVEHAINFLHGRGVQTIGLYAYPHLTSFYARLGFNVDKDFLVMHTDQAGEVASQKLPPIEIHDLPKVCALDRACFGGDRTRLLQTILLHDDNIAFKFVEKAELKGYIAATVYPTLAWIGPLICQVQRRDAARLLVKAALSRLGGKTAYAVVSKADVDLMEVLGEAGFRQDFSVTRMFLGQLSAKNCIYMAESLERG